MLSACLMWTWFYSRKPRPANVAGVTSHTQNELIHSDSLCVRDSLSTPSPDPYSKIHGVSPDSLHLVLWTLICNLASCSDLKPMSVFMRSLTNKKGRTFPSHLLFKQLIRWRSLWVLACIHHTKCYQWSKWRRPHPPHTNVLYLCMFYFSALKSKVL